MTYNIMFQRDAIGVKSATCSCGWSAKVSDAKHTYPDYVGLDNAIAEHETHHAAELFPYEAGNV